MDHLAPAWISMGEALLIGLIVGIERESDKREERHAGVRDFISIAIAGGLCGVMHQAWITAAGLAAITAMLIVFRVQTPGRTGITTEIVAVVTFLLCVLTGTPDLVWGSSLAIALTVVLALFLDARGALRKFAQETLTELEYWDTLRFLAVVFVILPVLPNGEFGPYGFLNPRTLWIFVILVSSINYLGYFLQKYMGEDQGLRLTAVLGGIGSTTAATSAFAKEAGESPERWRQLASATVLSNTVLNPRVGVLLWLAGGPLLAAALPVLAAMTVAGLAFAWWLMKTSGGAPGQGSQIKVGNPFRILPALKFGVLFVIVRLLARWSVATFGEGGILASSLVGGLVDVDAISFSLAGITRGGQASEHAAVLGIVSALAANAVVKTGFAFSSGGKRFGWVALAGFAVMFSAAAALLLALG